MKKLISGLMCLSLLAAPLLHSAVQAADNAKKVTQIHDVALSNQGTLKGKAIDGQGKPLGGAKVSVRQNNREIATAVTTAEGSFEVAGLSTGIYEVQAGQGKGTLRAWDGQVAPPTAKHNVLIVSGATTRAQAGLMIDPLDTVTLGLAITGVTLGAVALSEDSETIIVSP